MASSLIPVVVIRRVPSHFSTGVSRARTSSSRNSSSLLPTPVSETREYRVAAMKVELAARTSQTGKTEDTPPPSPAAVDAPSAAEDAALLPDGGVRRRSGSGRFARSGSFRREVGRAAAETFLLTRLTLILLRYLGIGYRWIRRFLALCCYTFLLMPGFIQGLCY